MPLGPGHQPSQDLRHLTDAHQPLPSVQHKAMLHAHNTTLYKNTLDYKEERRLFLLFNYVNYVELK